MKPDRASFNSFVKHHTAKHEVFACPIRVLWRTYNEYCEHWGFERAEAIDFIRWLRDEEGVTIIEGGQGRLRRMASGMACLSLIEEAS